MDDNVTTLEWTPTAVQSIALQSSAKFTLFGGGRGSGKTDVAIHKMLYRIEHPKLLGLVLRKNSKDLTDFILRADKVWKYFGAKKTGSPQTGGVRFVFPNGGEVYTGHLSTPESFEAYQGWELTDIFIEELTHIATKDLFMKLVASLRSTDRSIPARLFATSNPNGAGAEWVKEFWRIGAVEPNTFFKENGVTKLYVHANVHDNPHLMKADPAYVKYLESLPDDLKQQWLYGSWEAQVTDNQYFGKIMKKAQDAGRIMDIPYESSLQTFVSFDLGVKDLMVMWVFQINGKEVRAVECYANRNQPLKHYSDYMKSLEKQYDILIESVFVPHDSAVREMTSDSLMTRKEKLEELGWNVELAPRVPREDGIEKVRELLSYVLFDKTRCKDGIHALKSYHREFDVKANRYKDTPSHEFSDRVDSFRYGALSLPDVMGYKGMKNDVNSAIDDALSMSMI